MNILDDEWEARQWISIVGIIVFSVIGTIVQSIYMFGLIKRRDKIMNHKWFLARGKGLVILHFIFNLYWASIHPIIVGSFFIFYPHQIFILCTLYSYGLLLLNLLITIFIIRCWLIYFNFNYMALQFEKLWKTKLLNEHYELGWFEQHKKLGNASLLLGIGSIFTIILCGCTIPYAYISQLSIGWHLLALVGIFILNFMSILIVLKLHSRKRLDNFGMRHELTIFVLLVMILTFISIIPFFVIQDNWIRLWIINLPIHFGTFFMNTYQLSNLLKQIIKTEEKENVQASISRNIRLSESSKTINNNSKEKSFDELKLIDILGDNLGINEFARWLIAELSLEHLLFLIEVAQYRLQFAIESKLIPMNDISKHRTFSKSQTITPSIDIETTDVNEYGKQQLKDPSDDNKHNDNDNETDDDDREYRFQLSSSIPVCATIIDNSDDTIKQATAIRDKFIPVKDANGWREFSINISGSKRKHLLQIDFTKLSNVELKHVFDNAYHEVFTLLELDSFQRYIASAATSKSVQKLLKKITKKKRRQRQRAKSREKRQSKKERQHRHSKKKGHRDRISSTSPSLRPVSAIKPLPMIKNISLGSEQKSLSLSLNFEDMSDMSDMEEESVNPSLTKSSASPGMPTTADVDEEQLSDPFNTLYHTHSISKSQTNATLEDNVHNVLHAASTKTFLSCRCWT